MDQSKISPGSSLRSLKLSFPPSPPSTLGTSSKESSNGASHATSECSSPVLEEKQPPIYPLPPKNSAKSILAEDLRTPDNHVARDPRLIRLTGVHPFNCEPPLTDLFKTGFLTNEDLHYVRNHGPVPECKDEEVESWTFTVEGMVDKPLEVSVRRLISDYEQFTYPVTLVCAGNRRKEQNVVRKSKGFSWGPAGLSTALWTGVPLKDLLTRARPRRGARYVCFEGADELPNGCYGTSVKLNWCLDPNRGILIAHKMNGENLHPDHGKPVRVVIPGQIGGRSVKWLRRIIVTEQPSSNWYHIFDNRVLPTAVTPETSANVPQTWRDERYAIYDLNTNSVISCPSHNETVQLIDGPSMYNVRGYAYAGGGKRIGRLEVTLDQGKNWMLADIDYPEDQYRLAADGEILYGGKLDMWWRETSFCWCFWELKIAIEELKGASDIMIRAMDESLMVQPRDMYWSVLGMMNNPWFRVVIHNLGHSLRFEHPTTPVLSSEGWMERVKKAGGNLSNGFWGEKTQGQEEAIANEPEKEIQMVNLKVNRLITLEDLQKHNDEKMPWFIVNGQVYDGTSFLEGHPGGAASIVGAAGQDVSDEFVTIHSENAKAMMPEYHIGELDKGALANLPQILSAQDADRSVFLDPKSWTRATLQEKIPVSADSKIFRFKLDHQEQSIGLPTGQHLMIRVQRPAIGETVIRAYTPLSESNARGWLDVLIKIYYDTPSNKGGKMTQLLDATEIGQLVDFKGPVGKFEYLGKGTCALSGRCRQVSRFNMICGGSGITPIFQILRAVMKTAEDPTECVLLNGNRVEEDILCRTQLDELVSLAPQKARLIHCLSRPGPSWLGKRGRIDKDLISAEFGSPSASTASMILLCGPKSMEQSIHGILLELGWSENDIVIF